MSRADDFLATAEELRLRRVRRRRWLFGAIVIVLLLVILLLIARPASHAIKAWQSRRHARQAFEFIAKEKWNDAQKAATAAYQLSPNEPEAMRAVARFLSRVRQPQALEFWDRLAKQQPLTSDDLRDEAAVALALGETGRAETAIKPLLANNGRDATTADWLLAAQLAAQRGAPNESAEALQHIFKDRAANSRDQFQAAVLALRVSAGGTDQDQKIQADAWDRIEQLAEGKDAAGLDALVLLAQRALAHGGTTAVSSPSTNTDATAGVPPDRIAKALEAHPLAMAPQKLLVIDLRIRAAPDEKAALIQAAVDRWKDAEVKSLVALATWLNGHGEYQRELDTITLQRAVQDKDLFLQRLDALGALGRWQEIKQALNSESFPLDPMISHMYLARCNAQLGEKTAAENNWQRALEAAAGDAAKLLTLADYAEKNGATSIAASAYDGAVATAPKLRVAWQGKLRLAQVSRDTKTIHAVLAEMLKLWPNDTAIQNDEAYTRLLLLPNGEQMTDGSGQRSDVVNSPPISDLRSPSSSSSSSPSAPITNPPKDGFAAANNEELITIERLAEALIQREPASLPHRTLLALARLKQGRPAAALEIYTGLRVPPNAASPSAVAVHAAVLAGNGQEQDARTEAGAVNWEQLLPEEQALIETLR